MSGYERIKAGIAARQSEKNKKDKVVSSDSLEREQILGRIVAAEQKLRELKQTALPAAEEEILDALTMLRKARGDISPAAARVFLEKAEVVIRKMG